MVPRSERLDEGWYERPETRGFADITSARHGQEAPLKAETSRYLRDQEVRAGSTGRRPSPTVKCDTCGRSFPHTNKWILISGEAIEAPQSGDPEAVEAWKGAGFDMWQEWTVDNHAPLYHKGGPLYENPSDLIHEKCFRSGLCRSKATVEVTLPEGAEVMMCQTHASTQ